MLKTKRIPVLILLHLLAFGALGQQTDTLLVAPELLGERDLQEPASDGNQPIKIVSGSRFPIDAADLPYSIYVITKEEIRRNGYETLVDALKMVPGIRVSQPGSAIEGETFQIRGLLGNTYAKILLNDVPIKSSFLASMPIGAQLPVKEAERIEVIFGTGASLYGSDTPAGIINIITKESDKPVFMQADLSVGGAGIRSLNVMFGGRLGRDKRIFKYFVYGSNVYMEDRKIFGDYGYNFNPGTYSQDSTYSTVPNYTGFPGFPVIGAVPHQSRRFGFIGKFKRFTISLESLYRRDHSSLGFNPTAYEYSNLLSSIGESTTRFNLNIFKEKEKKNRKTDFSVTFNNTESTSSTLAVHNGLSRMLLKAAEANTRDLGIESTTHYFDSLYNDYLAGPRYHFGFSVETRVEHIRNYRLLKLLTLTVGVNSKIALGSPLTGLFPDEQDAFLGGLNVRFTEQYHGMNFAYLTGVYAKYTESNGFSQLFYNRKKLKVAGGINFSTTFYQPGGGHDAISPSFAVLWNITERLNVRSSIGRAFRQANLYYETNSYAVLSQSNNTLYRPSNLYIQPEETISWETGIRLKGKNNKVGAEATWFLNRTTHLIQYRSIERYYDADSTDYYGELGYSNFDNSYLTYTGGSISLLNKFIIQDPLTITTQLNYSWLNPKWGVDGVSSYPLLNPPRGNMLKLRSRLTPFKKTTFIIDLIRYSQIASAYSPKKDSKFWTLDFIGRYAFTDRFDAYLKITNFFDKNYSGISPDADPADLLHYNPQSGRIIRLGMNYHIE